MKLTKYDNGEAGSGRKLKVTLIVITDLMSWHDHVRVLSNIHTVNKETFSMTIRSMETYSFDCYDIFTCCCNKNGTMKRTYLIVLKDGQF